MPFLTEKQGKNLLEKYNCLSLFLYKEKLLEKNCYKFLKFPSLYGHKVRYAIKANPHRKILQLFDKLGLSFEASSEFEFKRALKAGIKGEKIQLSSQQMPYYYWKEILSYEGVFNACSLTQLEEYGKRKPKGTVSIRINPGIGSGSHKKTNVGGKHSSFGIWHEYFNDIKKILETYELNLTKIHSHIGSGSNPNTWEKATSIILNFIIKNFPSVHTINLGGGFKIARTKEEIGTNLENLGKKIIPLFKKASQELKHKLYLEIEPGTALVANTAKLLCKVDDLSYTGLNKQFCFLKLNTGMDIITRPSLYGFRHPIKALKSSLKNHQYLIVGHCCENSDSFSLNNNNELVPYNLPKINIGDLLEIGGVGAYCSSMSLKAYNSFPTCPEIWLDKKGNFKLITSPQNIDDFTSIEQ